MLEDCRLTIDITQFGLDLVTDTVPEVLIPGHEDDQEADHEARHGHGEGSQRSKGEIFGQEVGQNSGYDG